jgi:CO dehydrogenase nickel-insertion accessory protein CooC1
MKGLQEQIFELRKEMEEQKDAHRKKMHEMEDKNSSLNTENFKLTEEIYKSQQMTKLAITMQEIAKGGHCCYCNAQNPLKFT